MKSEKVTAVPLTFITTPFDECQVVCHQVGPPLSLLIRDKLERDRLALPK
ncbi:MAG: hypothetical protein ACI82Z_001359 [Cellvibrionaceae bacterium]|jgi:hypothetical protein